MKKHDVKALIDDFINNAVIQGNATYEGDYKKGNKASNRLFKLGKIMEQEREIAGQILDVLLEHENINVRIWTLGKALDLNYKTKFAEETLRSISKMPEAGEDRRDGSCGCIN